MKRFIKSYISFTRTERMGLIALMSLLALLIIVRATMHLWLKPVNDDARSRQLAAAWAVFKNGKNNSIAASIDDTPRNNITITMSSLFPFDPNTLDSAGFRKLGLSEKTTAVLLHWRAKGKVFYKKEDLKGVYTLRPEMYERLAPYITIKNAKAANNYTDAFDEEGQPMPAVVNINKADSATLVRLKGIGPASAHKIIAYRRSNGAFTDLEELRALCHLPHHTFDVLRPHLSLK